MEMKTPFASPVKAYSIEYHVIGEDGQLVLDNRTTWKYNTDHQIVEIDQQNSNKDYSEKTIYSYDENLKLQEMVVKVAEGEVKRRLVYEYEDDLLTQVTEVAGDYKIVTKYDDQGNPAEKSTYTRSDYLVSNTVFVNLYDQNGRLVEKHSIFPMNDSSWIDKYQYDEDGRLIEEQKTRNQLVSIIKHNYNSRGDLILSDFNPGQPNYETLKRDIEYSPDGDILEIKEYRRGWCYQDRNEEFGLTAMLKHSYQR